ncbi:MAG: FAD-dependent oxidoreductase [Lentisphaerae bacterium]|nr:FAD-dependent oxidoreductase [Lentisphaerota bacterium]
MNQTITFQRNIPVRHDVDIFIAGGGPAGCAAAVVAAETGASVFLAEDLFCFGGAGTAGMVPAFMRFGDGINFLAAGFGERLLDRLIAANGAGDPGKDYDKTGGFSIEAEVLKRVYDDLMTESGANFSFGTRLIAVEHEAGHITRVVLAGKSGIFAVRAKVYVDTTGDGDLCTWAGAQYEKGDSDGNMMPGTLCSLWTNIDFAAVGRDLSGVPANTKVEEAFKDGIFSYCDKHLPGMWYIRKNIGGGNIGHTFGVDGTDERSLTEAVLWGRRSMLEYTRYYREYLGSGYSDMDLVGTGAILGIRETRRIICDTILKVDAFKTRASFPDEIGRFNYPVDIHVTRPNDEVEYQRFVKEISTMCMGKGESYGIPYGTLLPRGLDNVLVAGRCISTDRAMQSSVRVMPGCYITGQAAGMAAAIAADTNTTPRAISMTTLRSHLRKIGTHLP